MSRLIQQAIDWRIAFGHPVSESREQIPNCPKVEFQLSLIDEEFGELHGAAWDLIETIVQHTDYDNATVEEIKKARQELLKEMADSVFVIYQLAAYLGMNLDEAMDRVFTSNMSKLDENGKPIYNEKGKVMKGPNYQPPDLSDIA
jgi:predicted HAD superfamily Cof-like phosphohydrolase